MVLAGLAIPTGTEDPKNRFIEIDETQPAFVVNTIDTVYTPAAV